MLQKNNFFLIQRGSLKQNFMENIHVCDTLLPIIFCVCVYMSAREYVHFMACVAMKLSNFRSIHFVTYESKTLCHLFLPNLCEWTTDSLFLLKRSKNT